MEDVKPVLKRNDFLNGNYFEEEDFLLNEL